MPVVVIITKRSRKQSNATVGVAAAVVIPLFRQVGVSRKTNPSYLCCYLCTRHIKYTKQYSSECTYTIYSWAPGSTDLGDCNSFSIPLKRACAVRRRPAEGPAWTITTTTTMLAAARLSIFCCMSHVGKVRVCRTACRSLFDLGIRN